MVSTKSESLKERMFAIIEEAKEQGLTWHDLLPFDLDSKEDVQQLRNDLVQQEMAIKFYRNLMNEAEGRATKYQQEYEKILQKQNAAESMEKKMARLEVENRDLQKSRDMVGQEMNKMKDIYEQLRDKDLALIVDKEEKIMAMEKQIKVMATQAEEFSKENSAVEEQYQVVMSSLDAVITDTTTDLNNSKAHASAIERQQSVTFSEIQPLRKFYDHANGILEMYQDIFRQLLNPTEPDVAYPPDFDITVSDRLQKAKGECEAFSILRASIAAEEMVDHHQSEQLSDLAQSAQKMQKTMEDVGRDLNKFLSTIQRRPDLLKRINLKFGVLR